MNFEREKLIGKLDVILGFIKVLEISLEEERDKLDIDSIDKLTPLLKELLNDARNYLVNAA